VDKIKISIKENFISTPGPRYKKEGKWSGEQLRIDLIYPNFIKAIEENKKFFIDLDGTSGYGTSFLEEVFGGLIRINKLKYSEINNLLELKSEEEPYLIEDIEEYLLDAKNQDDE
jgi:hypothetical protein